MKATNSEVVINRGTNIVTGMGKWYLKNATIPPNGKGMYTPISNICLLQSCFFEVGYGKPHWEKKSGFLLQNTWYPVR